MDKKDSLDSPLVKAYSTPESRVTSDIYRQLSERTEVEQKKLRDIFAVFYDIIAENVTDKDVHNVSFDNALTISIKKKPERVKKNSDGSVTVYAEELIITPRLGGKIKERIIELYESQQED